MDRELQGSKNRISLNPVTNSKLWFYDKYEEWSTRSNRMYETDKNGTKIGVELSSRENAGPCQQILEGSNPRDLTGLDLGKSFANVGGHVEKREMVRQGNIPIIATCMARAMR